MSRLRVGYFIAANTAILWLLLEAAAHVAIMGHQLVEPDFAYQHLSGPVKANYAHMTPADVEELWLDTMALRFRYKPIIGLVEDQMTSRFINIDARGIRSNGTAAADFDGTMWMFGGSTTLGYGVADHETIPAYLESALGRPVLNFGARAHYSATENRLLNHYLRAGFRPAMAIFLDGINESCEPDLDEDALGEVVARAQEGYSWDLGRPVTYLVRVLAHRFPRVADTNTQPRAELECRAAGTQLPLTEILDRMLAERAALCDLYQIACRTFVQPFPGLHGHYDEPGYEQSADAVSLRALFNHLEPTWRQAGATFVTGALDRLGDHAYVDRAHYSAAAHRLIANAIALNVPTSGATTTTSPTARRP